MGLAVVIVVAAAALTLATGGRLAALGELPIRATWLIGAAVGAQLVGAGLSGLTESGNWYAAGLATSAVTGLAFCLRNLQIAGITLIALGLISNAVVVAANGAMPVSLAAAARANVPILSIAAGDDPRHAVAGGETTLRWLGDIVPVPLPVRPEVASPGDVLLAAGLGEWLLLGTRRPRGQRRATSAQADGTPA